MITRHQFLRLHWGQYSVLEKGFQELLEYVDLRPCNMATCSNRIAMQLVTVCTVTESTIREMYGLPRSVKAHAMAEALLSDPLFSPDAEVVVVEALDPRYTVCPWESLGDAGGPAIPVWWDSYNAVKHHRFESFERANLESLLNAMAGLYYLEMLYAKRVGDYWYEQYGNQNSDDTMDVPNDVSRLFWLKNWETRRHVSGFDMYAMSDGDVDRITGR